MTVRWIKYGPIKMKIEHVEWRKGTAYFRRRIPSDVQKHYKKNKEYEFFSLKTKDPALAAKRSQENSKRLDRHWQSLRADSATDIQLREQALALLRKYGLEPGQAAEYAKYDIEPSEFVNELIVNSLDEFGEPYPNMREHLPDPLRLAADLFYGTPEEVRKLSLPSFSEVIDKHLYFHPKRAKDPMFERSVQRFLKTNGDLMIVDYRREHGNSFIKDLLESGVTKATVKRYLNQLRPIFNTAILELEIQMTNPLGNLKIPDTDTRIEPPRLPFSLQEIREIQARCRQVNDERRWLIAALSDTGARLSEIAGLLRSEVHLDADVPHIAILPNKVRGLKTIESSRNLPLVGMSHWAISQALLAAEGEFVFPEITNNGNYNGNATSSALNKWLKDQGLRNDNQPLHSFRHSLRDRLRNTGCPPDIIDRIGGWKLQGVGESYGVGHALHVLHSHMVKMIETETTSLPIAV